MFFGATPFSVGNKGEVRGLQIVFKGGQVVRPLFVIKGMGGGSKTQILLTVPVFEVVAAFIPIVTEVGDLVFLVSNFKKGF